MIRSELAVWVTRRMRERWPGAEVTTTTAGRGRVLVRVPPDVAGELRLAGPGASRDLAELALAIVVRRPVRVLGDVRQPDDPGGRFLVTLEIG